jgi:hypothetical protein
MSIMFIAASTGGILVGFVIGVVALITVVGLKSPGPETLQSVSDQAAAAAASAAAAMRAL